MTSTQTEARLKPRRYRLTDLLTSSFMARLDNLDVVSRKILQGRLQGERRSKRRGQSVEFADHRPYVAGDDLRFVDWNIYGRLDQLFLKLFLEEQDLTVHLLLDTSASMGMGEPAKDRFAKQLCAALGYMALVNNNRVTVSTFGDGLGRQLRHMRGRSYLASLAELLLTVDCVGPSDFERSCRQVTEMRSGTGVVVVLSDFLFKEGYAAGLRRLVGRHYDLMVLQILAADERVPTLSGDLKLVDIEDGDEAEITVTGPLLKQYHRTVAVYCDQLKTFCHKHQAQYVLADTGGSVETLVLQTLRRAGLLRS